MTGLAPEQIIVLRLLREITPGQRIVLGPGIPRLAAAQLPEEACLLGEGENRVADMAVFEAFEVSEAGDFSLQPGEAPPVIETPRWIIAARHTRQDGGPRIVRACQHEPVLAHCVSTIITEMGVIEVAPTGLVLVEVVPGVSTDDVKKCTGASLHIADDLKLVEL